MFAALRPHAVIASVNNWERTMAMDRQWERTLEQAFDAAPQLQAFSFAVWPERVPVTPHPAPCGQSACR